MITSEIVTHRILVERIPAAEGLSIYGRMVVKAKREFLSLARDYFKNKLFMTRRGANDTIFDLEPHMILPLTLVPVNHPWDRQDPLTIVLCPIKNHGMAHHALQVQLEGLPEGERREVALPTPPINTVVWRPNTGPGGRIMGLLARNHPNFNFCL